MKLFLIRHGQSELGALRIVAGWSDPKLSPLGEEQSRTAAEQLRDKHIDAIFSSDLQRAHQTATIIQAELSPGLPLLVDWRLRERNLGTQEQQPYGRIDWGGLDDEADEYHALYAVEKLGNFRARLIHFLKDLSLLPKQYHNIVVATSGGILIEAERLLHPDATDFDTPNAKIVEYELDELLAGAEELAARTEKLLEEEGK